MTRHINMIDRICFALGLVLLIAVSAFGEPPTPTDTPTDSPTDTDTPTDTPTYTPAATAIAIVTDTPCDGYTDCWSDTTTNALILAFSSGTSATCMDFDWQWSTDCASWANLSVSSSGCCGSVGDYTKAWFLLNDDIGCTDLTGDTIAFRCRDAATDLATWWESCSLCANTCTPTPAHYYVDPENGDNDDNGLYPTPTPDSENGPWKTFTHALDVVWCGSSVTLLGGTYSQSSGETFPLDFGDHASGVEFYGQGSDETLIQGGGGENVINWTADNADTLLYGVSVSGGLHGIYVEGGKGTIDRVRSHDNWDWGLLCAATSTIEVQNSIFDNNTHHGVQARTGSDITLTYSTIVDNADVGLEALSGASLCATHCIVWDCGGKNVKTDATAYYSDIEDATWTAVNGNITSDPLFWNADIGDYRLFDNSPCVDAATTTVEVSWDHGGVTRPQYTEHDLGAYEYDGDTPTNTPTDTPPPIHPPTLPL